MIGTRHAALDALLMVQGWRRYSWNRMAGIEPHGIKDLPEQGIGIDGRIVSMARQRPQPDMDVSLLLLQKGKEEEEVGMADLVETFTTDKDGRFSFTADVDGRWNMIFGVTEKGKPRNHLVMLNRLFSPKPKRYRFADMQVSLAEEKSEPVVEEETLDDMDEFDYKSFIAAWQDSLARLGIDEKIINLDEVTVTAKRNREQNIYHSRATSVAYYDVHAAYDDLYDSGSYTGDNIHTLMMKMNEKFSVVQGYTITTGSQIPIISGFIDNTRTVSMGGAEYETLLYNNRPVIFVIDYEPVFWDEFSIYKYQQISLRAIKNVRINEEFSVVCQWIDRESFIRAVCPFGGCSLCDMVDRLFSRCVVFIETNPDGEIPVEEAKGVRKTWLEGYSPVKEFYNPNYTELPLVPDYRRTLYWNPSVTPDENGIAKIQFYNNSSSRNFNISAETVTPLGMIGIN